MPTTPVYGLPYQGVNDPPNGPTLGEDLAEAVETELVRIDAAATTARRPCVALARSNATLSHNTVTTISWTSQLRDTDNMWTSGTDITIPRAGLWMVFCAGRFASQATVVGFRQVRVNVNGVEQWSQNAAPTTALNATNSMSVLTYPLVLAASDVVTFSAYQNSGGNLDLLSSTRCAVWLMEGD